MSISYLSQHKKHIIILSGAGKPVFSRYPAFGEDGLAVCALLRAICSKTNDQLTLIKAGGAQIVFQNQVAGITLVCVCSPPTEPVKFLEAQMDLLFKHILFHTTKPALVALFDNEPSFDLSSLLCGTEGEALALVHKFHYDFHLVMAASRSRRLPRAVRKMITDALEEAVRGETQAMFAIVLSAGNPHDDESNNYSLVASQSAIKSLKIPPPQDMLLLCNFVELRAPQLATGGETWTPLCLPDYDSSGNFHVYVSEMDSHSRTVLLLLMEDASLDHFHRASKFKTSLVERFQSKVLPSLSSVPLTCSPADLVGNDGQTANIIHVVIRAMAKPTLVPQYLESKVITPQEHGGDPVAIKKYRKYLVRRYAAIMYDIHASSSSSSIDQLPTKVVWNTTPRDAVLVFGSLQDDVLIGAVFTPFTTKTQACAVMLRIRMFVDKEMLDLFF